MFLKWFKSEEREYMSEWLYLCLIPDRRTVALSSATQHLIWRDLKKRENRERKLTCLDSIKLNIKKGIAYLNPKPLHLQYNPLRHDTLIVIYLYIH